MDGRESFKWKHQKNMHLEIDDTFNWKNTGMIGESLSVVMWWGWGWGGEGGGGDGLFPFLVPALSSYSLIVFMDRFVYSTSCIAHLHKFHAEKKGEKKKKIFVQLIDHRDGKCPSISPLLKDLYVFQGKVEKSMRKLLTDYDRVKSYLYVLTTSESLLGRFLVPLS